MSIKASNTSASRISVKALVIDAMMTALVLVFTMFINIRLPFVGNGGLIHLGNVPLFIAAIVFGKRTGAICGALGMGLFDLISGWTAWAPFTFVIVGLMGYSIGKISEKKQGNSFVWNLIAMLVALVIKIVGYYFAEVILFGNWIVPFGSVPGNLVQIVLAMVISLPLVPAFKKAASIISRS